MFLVDSVVNYCDVTTRDNSTLHSVYVSTCTLCLVGVQGSLLCGFGGSAKICIVPIRGCHKVVSEHGLRYPTSPACRITLPTDDVESSVENYFAKNASDRSE